MLKNKLRNLKYNYMGHKTKHFHSFLHHEDKNLYMGFCIKIY